MFSKGLKQTEAWYYSTAIYILSNVPDASLLTIQDKIRYLEMSEFKSMKIMLAYAEQFTNMMEEALEMDLEYSINSYIN